MFSASAELSETLGSSQLLGARLSDFVDHDDVAALERLYDPNRKLYPLLVSCRRTPRTIGRQAVTFDAKITPYAVSGSLLHICFQVQGEVREDTGVDHHTDEHQDQMADLTEAIVEPKSSSTENNSGEQVANEKTSSKQKELCQDDQRSEISFALTITTQGSRKSRNSRAVSAQSEMLVNPQSSTVGPALELDIPQVEGVVVEPRAKEKAKHCPRPPKPPTSHRVTLATRKRFMKRFTATPDCTIHQLLLSTLLQLNVRGKGCCFRHIGLVTLHRCIYDLMAEGCCQVLKPNKDWQCALCLAGHRYRVGLECEICGQIYTENPEHAALLLEESPSTGMADDEESSLSSGQQTPPQSSDVGT